MASDKNSILSSVISNTESFIASVPKSKRKKFGQFFTTASTAEFMAQLFEVDFSKQELHVLDAGAGTGILTIALLDHIFAHDYKGKVYVTCYETDKAVLPVLEKNLLLARQRYNIDYIIRTGNYITGQHFCSQSLFGEIDDRYDYVIGNPPYLKISKDSPEAKVMTSVCHGAPNMYFLFWAMGIHNLKPGGELVYIVPRSWTSGAYFRKFRDYLFDNCTVTHIHLFESRNKVFANEPILQETIIIKVIKSEVRPDFIRITTSSTSDFNDLQTFYAPYNIVMAPNHFVYLVTDSSALNVLKRINTLPNTLPDLHTKMQTGIIVDFRTKEVLRNNLKEGGFPLLYAHHIKNGKVIWPLGKEGEVIKTEHKAYLQKNSDFLIVKRFTSKEEKRRLQCGIYLKQNYSDFPYISTQNKVNYIRCDSPCLVYGLYVLLNSSLYDAYYRILNGSTQVNSTEINQIPIPERRVIEAMGREIMSQELTEHNCDQILDKWIS